MSSVPKIAVQNLDHLGLVAGLIDEIGIVEKINRHLRKCSKAFIDRLLAGQMPPASLNAFNDFIRITDALRAKGGKILAIYFHNLNLFLTSF